MFDLKDQTRSALDAGMEVIRSHERGDKIPLEEFEAAFSVTRRDNEMLFRYFIHALQKRLMRERGIVLASMTNNTQTPLTDRQQAEWYPKQQRKKRWRSTSRVRKALAHVNREVLTTHERMVVAITEQHLRAERRQLRQTVNAVRATPTIPVRPFAKV